MSDGVGAALRRIRESQGISLQRIAAATKLAPSALEAIERDDLGRLPGGIFTRAFVRAYAKELGADPERTLETFLAQFPDHQAQPHSAERHHAESTPRSKYRAAEVVVAVGILMVPLAFGILWFASAN
jgi:cytoskeleton protein RodZ